MANTKHKSKYKAPKDLEKSQKPKPRKDLKDYTTDDKKGGLNPKSTGDKQLNVLRKTDKEMVDTGDMYQKYNADDRLYKDLAKGEYEPKDAAKKLKKRQDKEEKETADVLKDKIENLTREQKERLVREYVRRKIVKILTEQPEKEAPAEETPTETEAPAETPVDAAAAEEPMPTDMATPPPTEPTSSAPTDTIVPPPTDTAAASTEPATPTGETPETDTESKSETLDAQEFLELGNIKRISRLVKFLKILDKQDASKQRSFYHFLKQLAIKKIASLPSKSDTENSKSDTENTEE